MTLAEFLETRQIKSSAFAVRLEVPASTVHRWLRGKRLPSSESLIKIEKATGGQVKVGDFFPCEITE